MLRNYTPAFNVKLDKIMAITDLQISEELQTGAPSIKYRGNEGPQAPMRMAAGEDPLLVEEYKKYVFEMQEQGLQPMSFEQFKQQAMSGMAEGGRPGYGLGSIIKKITRPVKKVLGSDVGKAALTAAAMYKLGGGNFFGPNRAAGFSPGNILPGFKKFMVGAPGGVSMGGNRGVGQGIMTKGTRGILGAAGKLSPWKAMTAASLIPFTGMGMGSEQEGLGNIAGMDDLKFDFNYDDMIAEVKAAVSSGDVEEIKRVNLKYGLDLVEDTNVYAAKGGRIGYYSGGQSIPSKNSLEDARKTAMQDRLGGITEVMKLADLYRQGDVGQMYAAQGGRIGYDMGGDVEDKFMELVAELREQGYTQQEAIDEAKERLGMAQGGRIGYAGGGSNITLSDGTIVQIPAGSIGKYGLKDGIYSSSRGDLTTDEIVPLLNPGLTFNQGGRVPAQEGGIMDLGGMEKDYRETGGFVDLGAEEKADDVPARLSVNEFVMTADAVRGAGDGDIDKGAERMEDLMEKLEAKNKRQQGASDMFEVSERLSEVV